VLLCCWASSAPASTAQIDRKNRHAFIATIVAVGEQKEKQPGWPAAFQVSYLLEAELRSRGYAQVVVGAVIEIHFVADINTQADRAGERFHTDTGIEDAVSVARSHAIHRANEAGDRSVIRGVEVDEATLQGSEEAPCPGAGDDLRTEQAGQAAQPDAVEAGESAEGRGTSNVALKVVGHLRFQLDVTAKIEVEVRADAEGVQVIRICEAQIVCLHAEFAVMVRTAFIVSLRNGARAGGVLRCGRA